jgi:hypothetical protein
MPKDDTPPRKPSPRRARSAPKPTAARTESPEFPPAPDAPAAPAAPEATAATVASAADGAASYAASGAASGAASSASGSLAVLTFRSDWHESRHGDITAGGSLVVHYEPARLARDGAAPDGADVVGYARFLPGGEIRHATLATPKRRLPAVPDADAAALAAEIPIPRDTERVELWFQRVDPAGVSSWDSRFGANYAYDVVPPTPASEPTVAHGAGAATRSWRRR